MGFDKVIMPDIFCAFILKQLYMMNTLFKKLISVPFMMGLLLQITCAAQAQMIMTLENAMDVAIKNSPEILKSELNMTISEENLKAQEAATKSLIRFQLTPLFYDQTRAFNSLFSTWNTTTTKRISGDLTLSQPIKLTDGRITLTNQFSYQDAYSDYSDSRSKGYSNYLFLNFSQPIFTYNRLKMTLNQLRLSLENATLSYAIQR